MKWSQDDVTDYGIDVSLVGQEVFDVATMPVIYNDISHLTKNAGKTVQDIISKTCAGDKLGIGNSNKRLLIDHVQHQFKMFYKLEDERTPELWKKRVETMLCHLADDHSNCDKLECDPEKRKDVKPICHQLLSPTYTFKKAQEKFDSLISKLRAFMMGNCKEYPKDMPLIMTYLGTTSTIEASHARITNRDLLRKGAPINILTNTVEARLSIGSILQNEGMDQLVQKISPSTTKTNRDIFVARVLKAQAKSRSNIVNNKIKLSKKRKGYKKFNSKVATIPCYVKNTKL